MSEDKSRGNRFTSFLDLNKLIWQLPLIIITLMIVIFIFRSLDITFRTPIDLIFATMTFERMLNFVLLFIINGMLIFWKFTPKRPYFVFLEYKPERFEINIGIAPYDTKRGDRYVENVPVKTIGDKKFANTSVKGTTIDIVDHFRFNEEKGIIEMKYSETMALSPIEFIANIKAILLHAETERSNYLELMMYRGTARREIISMVTYFMKWLLQDHAPELEFSSEIPKTTTLLYDRIRESNKPMAFMETEHFQEMKNAILKDLEEQGIKVHVPTNTDENNT